LQQPEAPFLLHQQQIILNFKFGVVFLNQFHIVNKKNILICILQQQNISDLGCFLDVFFVYIFLSYINGNLEKYNLITKFMFF